MKRLFNTLLILLTLLGIAFGQEIKVIQKSLQVPVLKNKRLNPVLQLHLSGQNRLKAYQMVLDFKGTSDMGDVDSLFIFDLGQDSTWTLKDAQLLQRTKVVKTRLVVDLSLSLTSEKKFLMFAVKLSEETSLNHQISIGIEQVIFSNGTTLMPPYDTSRIKHRVGVAVRKAGDDGIAGYRIPGLAQTKDGALLAIYDARRESRRDLQGDIDIGLSRSTDGGNSWEPMRIALDMGTYGGLPEKYNGVSDACILVDQFSKEIYVAGCWMYGVIDEKTRQPVEGLQENSVAWNHQWRKNGSLPGFDIAKTSQFLLTKSTDDGKTWSEPINLTKQMKKAEWHLFAPAPGSGITLQDGTLVFPTQGKDEQQQPFSNITYSKDRGKTWHASKPSFSNTTENMVVQLKDGRIMQNMRDNRNATDKSDKNGRAIFTTKDLGNTWQEHSSHHGALIEPRCMASIIRHNYTDTDGKPQSILVFSNPNSKYNREKMTIKVSFDEGKTWPKENWLLLDVLPLQGGYSSLTSMGNDSIGILYEGSQAQMTFERISLRELGITNTR